MVTAVEMCLEYTLWRHWEKLRKDQVRKCEKWRSVVHSACMIASSCISLTAQTLTDKMHWSLFITGILEPVRYNSCYFQNL